MIGRIVFAIVVIGVGLSWFGCARAAEDEPPGHRSWQLWAKEPGEPEWRMRGKPLGQTACMLDMTDLTMKAPSGTRAACVKIQVVPVKVPR